MSLFRERHFERIVDIYGRSLIPRVFVETGTYRGKTIEEVCGRFDRVHSIELSEKWHQRAVDKFRSHENVVCHLGDSAAGLKRLIPELSEPAIFYLDAHYSGGETALGSEEVPLVRELMVLSGRKHMDVIIIDDAGLIGKKGVAGEKDDELYPLMEFDWTGVSLAAIRHALRGNRWLFWKEWDNRIFIITNQSLGGLAVRRIRTLPFIMQDYLSLWKRRVRDVRRIYQQETAANATRLLSGRVVRWQVRLYYSVLRRAGRLPSAGRTEST